jgi:hypothetical protein
LLAILKNVILSDSFPVDLRLDGFRFGEHTNCWLPIMYKGSSIDFVRDIAALAADDFLFKNKKLDSVHKYEGASRHSYHVVRSLRTLRGKLSSSPFSIFEF